MSINIVTTYSIAVFQGKGLMKTYWLTGEDSSRRQQRMQRGIARHDRVGSNRRKVKLDKPSTPTYGFRSEGSPQMQHPGHSQSLNTGSYGYAMDSPANFRQINFLHPYSLLVGPTSQDLIRRSSSRRRRLKFAVGSEEADKEASLSGDEADLEPLEFTSESIPTIIRSKMDRESASDGEGSKNKSDRSISPTASVTSGKDNEDDSSREQSSKDCQTSFPLPDSTVSTDTCSSASTQSLVFACREQAPIVRIESLEFDNLNSPKRANYAMTSTGESDSKGNDQALIHVGALKDVVLGLGKTPNGQYANIPCVPKNMDLHCKDQTDNDTYDELDETARFSFQMPETLSECSKNIRAINGLSSGIPTACMPGNKVSPMFDKPNPFCSDGIEDDDHSESAMYNTDTLPFMDSTNAGSSCQLDIDTTPLVRQKLGGAVQSRTGKGCEVSDKLRYEMIPLLSNSGSAVNCGFVGGCDDDENV